jgi:hypothetical protein
MLRFSVPVVARWREVTPLRLVAKALATVVRARRVVDISKQTSKVRGYAITRVELVQDGSFPTWRVLQMPLAHGTDTNSSLVIRARDAVSDSADDGYASAFIRLAGE